MDSDRDLSAGVDWRRPFCDLVLDEFLREDVAADWVLEQGAGIRRASGESQSAGRIAPCGLPIRDTADFQSALHLTCGRLNSKIPSLHSRRGPIVSPDDIARNFVG